MKKLIKLTAKYEGKKSATSIGNIRETLKVVAALLAAEHFASENTMEVELEDQIIKMLGKAAKKFKSPATFEEVMSFLITK